MEPISLIGGRGGRDASVLVQGVAKAYYLNWRERDIRNQLSHSLLAFGLGEYWFWISLYVYDRNRPLAPILRQRRCCLMYDIYLTCIDGDV